MKIYTKTGDSGMTSLMNGIRVSKTDDRIELLGTIDELSANIGFAKVIMKEKEKLSTIQQDLFVMMAGIADPCKLEFSIKKEQISNLEEQIDEIEKKFPREKKFTLYGGCETSARLDIARAVARRVERRFHKVSQQYEADSNAIQYINRLSDYLYMLARYEDYKLEKN